MSLLGRRPVATERVARNWIVLASGLAAGLPIIVATIHGVVARWVPYGDDGIVASRAYDVFTSATPLVGNYSSAPVTGQPLHKPGPLLFWLFAVPAHFFPPVTMTVLIGLVNLAAVIAIVFLANRRGGQPLMLATAGAVALMLASLGGGSLHDVWDPSAAMLSFTLLIYLSWAVACGEYRWLPLVVLVASFVIQAHLTFLLPTLGMLVVAAVGLILSRRSAAGSDRQASVRRSVVGAGLVAVVCWLLPLLDEAIHHPGNLTLLARTGLHSWPKLGAASGWHAVVHAIGIPPWWLALRGPPGLAERIHDLMAVPNGLQSASAALVMGGLLVVTVLGWRHGRRDVGFAGALGLVLCAALFQVVASSPAPSSGEGFLTNGYVSVWGSPAGMWVWLTVGWSVATLVAPVRRWGPIRRIPLASTTAIVAVVAIGGTVAARQTSDPLAWIYGLVRNSLAHTHLPRGGTVRLESCLHGPPALGDTQILGGAVYALRRRGVTVETDIAGQLSTDYAIRPGRKVKVLAVGTWPCPKASTSSTRSAPRTGIARS